MSLGLSTPPADPTTRERGGKATVARTVVCFLAAGTAPQVSTDPFADLDPRRGRRPIVQVDLAQPCDRFPSRK